MWVESINQMFCIMVPLMGGDGTSCFSLNNAIINDCARFSLMPFRIKE